MYRTILHIEYENKTPEEVFSGKKLEFSHLRIFGCPVYIHIPKEKRTKLDPSGKKGIFVGYSESSKAYRICFPGYKKIDVSRDVTFDEDTAYNKSRKRPTEEPEEAEAEAPRIRDAIMNEEDDEDEGSRRSIPTKQIKISIQLSFHDIFLLYICLY